VSQIVHCPAVFDDQERYPFGDVLFDEDPDSENQGERFDHPEDRIEGLFVAGFCLVIGDVSQKFPHEVGLAGGTPLQTVLAEMVTARGSEYGNTNAGLETTPAEFNCRKGLVCCPEVSCGFVLLNWPTLNAIASIWNTDRLFTCFSSVCPLHRRMVRGCEDVLSSPKA